MGAEGREQEQVLVRVGMQKGWSGKLGNPYDVTYLHK